MSNRCNAGLVAVIAGQSVEVVEQQCIGNAIDSRVDVMQIEIVCPVWKASVNRCHDTERFEVGRRLQDIIGSGEVLHTDAYG